MFQWVLTDAVLAHLKCLPTGDDDDSEKLLQKWEP